MDYKLAELLDIQKLQALLDSLDELYSIPSAIIDMEGNILTGTAWQDICVKFHRANPESEKECIKSDTHIVSALSKGGKQVVYKCPKGLVDTATPIMVEGEHLGNAFTGQFFLEPPDEEHFRELAREYNFDEEAYIDAMRRVPVITEDKHRKNLKVLSNLTQMLAEMGLKEKRQLESESRLRELNEDLSKYLFALNSTNDEAYLIGPDGKFEYVNYAACSKLGYTKEELQGMSAPDVDPLYRQEVWDEHFLELKEKGSLRFESLHRRKDGSTFPVEISANYFRYGESEYNITFARDITNQKTDEKKLRDSALQFKTLYELSQMRHAERKEIANFVLEKLVEVTNSETGFLGFMNEDESLLEIHAWSRKAMEDCKVKDRPAHLPIKEAGIWAEAARQRKDIVVNDYGAPSEQKKGMPKGHVPLRRFVSAPIFDGNKIIIVAAVANKDEDYSGYDIRQIQLLCNGMWNIIKVQQADETLKVSEAMLKKSQEIGHIGSWHMDIKRNVLAWSDEVYKIFGHTPQSFDSTYEAFLESVHPDDRELVNRTYTEAIENKTPYECVHRVLRPDGETRTVLEKSEDIVDENGETIYSLGVVLDITELKKKEDRIVQSLKEKEVLLREVHHRVKNNMAVINSLLTIQAPYIKNPDAIEQFQETKNRIRAMALVHEKLYATEDFARINLREYVESLSRHIVNTLGENVTLDIDIADIVFEPDVLIPCGLIINEVLTNSFKHAFDNSNDNRISITAGRDDRGMISLAIKDNGKGLPEGFEPSESQGLGLKIINSLISQLQGSMKAGNDNGAVFKFVFPEKLRFAGREQ